MAFTPDQQGAFALVRQLVPTAVSDRRLLLRELAILRKLRRLYEPLSFWRTIKPAAPLDSLSYFVAPYGAEQLRLEWAAFRIGAAEKARLAEEALDREVAALERSLEPTYPIPLDTPSKDPTLTPTRRRPASAVAWADSPD